MTFPIKRTITPLAVIALFALGMFLGYESRQTAMASEKVAAEAVERAVAEKTGPGRPIRIQIPSIGVNAKLENVGLKADSSMGAPLGPVNAAWFYSGPVPGAKGNAVIDGHYGWKDGIRAVFDDLHKTKAGEMIYIEDQKGIITAFIVTNVITYTEGQDTYDIFNSRDDGYHLNLITCGGAWDRVSQHYADRTVVLSDRIL